MDPAMMSRPSPTCSPPGDETSTGLFVSKKDKTSILASNSAKISPDKVAKSKAPFRYRWQKNGRFAYQDALVESENADSPGDKKDQRGVVTKFDAEDNNGAESGDEYVVHQYAGAKRALGDCEAYEDENYDVEFKQEDSDGDYEDATARKEPIGGASKKQQYKMTNQTPNPNGRVIGRKLVMWHRPRMIEKLMLHLQYECHRAGIKLPWDKVVERLSTGSSGTSALQHLNKLRDILITEGHMVPPLLGKYSVPQDPTVRGYIRDMDADKPIDTKVVRWGEFVEDRKDNLEIEGVIRGSGNYRRATTTATYQRGLSKALEKTQKATGMRRNRLPMELRDTRNVSNETAGTIKKEKPKKERIASADSSRSVSLDPAELASDDEYDPFAIKKKGKYGLRKGSKLSRKYKVESSDEQTDDEVYELDEEQAPNAISSNTPRNKRLKGHDQGEGLITPPSMKMVTLKIRPDLLRQEDARMTLLTNEVMRRETIEGHEHSNHEMENNFENGSDYGADVQENSAYGTPTRQYRPSQVHPLAQDIVRQLGYQGMDVHGTKAQYTQALEDGVDPNVNGIKYKQAVVAARTKTVRKSLNEHHAGTSAGYSPSNPRDHSFTTSMTGTNYRSFEEAMNSYSGYDNTSVEYGGDERMVVDPFYNSNQHYTSGSDIFQTDSSFNAHGLPAMSYYSHYHGQAGFEMGLDGNASFEADNSPNTMTFSSASDFQSTADDNATATPTDVEIHGDSVSLAGSTPPHYLDYTQEGDEDKENQNWNAY